MFSTQLKALPNQIEITRKMEKEDRSAAHNHNSALYEGFLSDAFDGRATSCFMTGSDFWVYAQSIEEAEVIKAKAKGFGYTNIETLEPWSGDPDNRQADPKGAYAVRVCEMTDLIIGKPAQSLVKLFSELAELVKDHITYTYAHLNTVTYTFNDAMAATLFAKSILDFNMIMEKANTIATVEPIAKYTLDTFKLTITLSSIS